MASKHVPWRPLTDNVGVYRPLSISIGVIQDGKHLLLIDCDDSLVVDKLEEEGYIVETVLFTHYHRDSAAGAPALARKGVDVVVPNNEREYFESAREFWTDSEFRWRLIDFRPHPLLLTESVDISNTLEPGDDFHWRGHEIEVVGTPGHTEHSLSFLVSEGNKKYAFCGDAICGDGQLWDLYSLQRGNGDLHDYHEYLGDRHRYLAAVSKLAKSDTILPSRGPAINTPTKAIENITQRINQLYQNYSQTSALRHYFPQIFGEISGENPMPAELQDDPSWVRHVGTSWVLLSEDDHALVIDCGVPAVLKKLEEWGASGEIQHIDTLWISHYHHDHVDEIPQFRSTYDSQIVSHTKVADVVENPGAYRLPCQSPEQISVDRRVQESECWQWKDWTLSSYWFPGQTHYHSALLAEGHGYLLLFIGDSFTETGMDDYCTRNRIPLGDDQGYNRCLRIIRELNPTHLFNCHLEKPFNFSDGQLDYIESKLRERESLLDDLLMREHLNFGVDPYWIRCYPYDGVVTVNERNRVQLVVDNYADKQKRLSVRPEIPAHWTWNSESLSRDDQGRLCKLKIVDRKSQERINIVLEPSADEDRSLRVIPITVRWGDLYLNRYFETRLKIQ